MTEASADRLALLYRVSQTFNSSLDLDEVLGRVMDEVIAATHAERGFVMLREADGQLKFRAARGLDQQTIDAPEFQISRGLVERVAQEGQPVLTMDAQNEAWLQSRASVVGLKLRSILCVPLQLKSQVIGVVYVENRLQAGLFSEADRDLLAAIASSAAVAIENARLYQVAVEKGRLEQELQTARQVQAGLLPKRVPALAGWEFAARWQPAREVAGDFYDFVPGADGRLALIVGDVTDKGMPAALFMAHTRSVVRASLGLGLEPAEALTRANCILCADETRGMFVTLGYACLTPGDGRLTWVSAGHNPALLIRAGGEVERLERTGMPLAVDADLVYRQRVVELAAGDLLLIYTDGVTDALNADVEEFGEARLREVLLAQRAQSAESVLDALVQSVAAFTGAADPFDDITLVLARKAQITS